MSILKHVTVWGVTFEVDFDGTPFVPARTYGPPEDCFPAGGGEPEILGVYVEGVELQEHLRDDVINEIHQQLTQYLCGDCEAERQAEAMEAREEARREEVRMAFDRR